MSIIKRFASENFVENSVQEIIDGDILVAKASQDANGNDIASTYETKTNVESKLAESRNYADTAALNAATQVKNELLNGAGEAIDTLKELADLIEEKQDAITALETIAANKANKSDLFSKSYNDLTDKPTIPSIEGLASETYVQEEIEKIEIYDDTELRALVANKANKSELFSKDYNDLTNKPEIPSTVGLASETYVQNTVANKADRSELFSKDYNDLTNKPVIPSIEGLASETYVQQQISNKADKSELFSKSYNDLTDKPSIPSIDGLASETYVDT